MTFRLDQFANRTVAVWGAGLEGRAALGALPPSCRRLIVVDDPSAPAVVAAAAEYAAEVLTPGAALDDDSIVAVVRSPGVSIHRPEVASLRDRGVLVTSLLSLWLPRAPVSRTIGVTGTKGKSTTTLLIAALLSADGQRVEVAGNIGRPFSEVEPADIAVIEVSSYQAADLTVSPTCGALTNLDVDHLPWHGSVEQYHADKLRLFAHPELEHLVAPVSCTDALRAYAPSAVAVSRTPADLGYTVADGHLVRRGQRLTELVGTVLEPLHLADDLAIACATADSVVGRALDADVIAATVYAFTLPPGRLEIVPTADGITWVNDPLASNPFAAAAAVRTYRGAPLVVIVGGDDRRVDPAPLVAAIAEHGAVRVVVAVGVAGKAWAAALERVAMVIAVADDDVAVAVDRAAGAAHRGDVVLFSPGAPTTRAVGNWEDRMRLFSAAVRSASARR